MKKETGSPRQRGDPGRRIVAGRVLGLTFAIAGFAAIVLGWLGAARRSCVDCQIPYLISGGAAGIALVGFGVGLLLLAQVRAEGRRLADRLAEWPFPEASQSDPETVPETDARRLESA